jgi:nicotinamide-nucleotide amidase
MASAEIITIGTEILLGEIVDTNARYLARELRDAGIDLYRKTSVGDNPGRIAQAIQEAMKRCEIIITTGGLGPTVDDPTREAIARAVGVETEFHPSLWGQIQDRFRRYNREPTENNKRMAFLPQGALAVENPVGTAPAFIFETREHAIIALPGVPREMEHLTQNEVIPYLRRRFDLREIIKARLLHTAGAGESNIDSLISDLEELSNPTVGLAAHAGQVDVRITAKAESQARADEMIAEIEREVRQRLSRWVYGADEETLEQVAMRSLMRKGWKLAVIESGLNGGLLRRLAGVEGLLRGGEVIPERPSPEELMDFTAGYRQARGAEVGFGVALHPGPETQTIHIALISPEGREAISRSFGGPPKDAPLWAVNTSLNLLRNLG